MTFAETAVLGAIGLATVLVIGFALHNATEGFGIVGPLGSVRPSWRWLLAAGLLASWACGSSPSASCLASRPTSSSAMRAHSS